MSWLDRLFNRNSTIETRLEVGDAALLRGENKACELDKFEVETITGRKMTTNQMYSRPWRYARTIPEPLKASDFGIDVSKLTEEQKAKLKETGWTW